jgi:hypothetical protein
MFLSDRDASRRNETIRLVRDVVEIIAIIAAGVWAFYVFIYDNRIKPSFLPPDLAISATMEKTSRDAGRIGVHLKTQFRNVGSVPIYFTGFAVTVLGQRLTPAKRSLPPTFFNSNTTEIIEPFFVRSKAEPVFGYGSITNLGNPSSPTGFSLLVGQDSAQEKTFFVPAGRFDVLTAYVSARYSLRGERVITATLKLHNNAYLTVTGDDTATDYFNLEVAALDLNS